MNTDLCMHLLYRYARRFVLICTCLLWPWCTDAQILRLPDAVNKAIANYPLIQQQEALVAAGAAHITTVEGNRLPSLKIHDQITLGTANSLNGSFFPMGVVVPTSGGVRSENNGDVASGNIALSLLEWEFYNFGYYKAERQKAEAGLAANKAGLRKDTYLLTGQIILLYIDLVKHYRLQQVEKENENRTITISDAIRATVLSGLKPGVDSMTAQAEYTKAHLAYQRAKEAYENDRAALATYTGLDAEAVIPDTAIFSEASAQQLQVVTDSIVTDHPLLAVYHKALEQQEAENKVTAHKYLPKFYLQGAAWMRGTSITSADVYTSDLASGLSYSRYNYLFGLAFTYNLFDLKHRHDQLAEGRQQALALQHATEVQQLNLSKAMHQADISYRSILEQASSIPQEMEAANQAYHQQLALYDAGLGTLTDVTNALYTLKQTEMDNVEVQDNLMQVLYMRAGLSNQTDNFLQMFKP